MEMLSFYECKKCERPYVVAPSQPIICPFCNSKERNILGDALPQSFINRVINDHLTFGDLMEILEEEKISGEEQTNA